MNIETIRRVACPMLGAVALIFGAATPALATALNPNTSYTVDLSKVNSDGSVTDVSTTTGTTDSTGKLSFSFTSGVPTAPSTNFVVLTIEDGNGNVVKKSVMPAPAAGQSNLVGINDLSNAQADMLLTAMQDAHTDDPILVAFGLIIVRAPGMTASDLTNMAQGGSDAIEGSGGFVSALQQAGITATEMATFRQELVHNSDANAKDLTSFTALFKSAVDDPTQATDDMAKAAGYLAEIFVDAGADAGISPTLILAAHEQAGIIANADPYILKISSGFMSSVGAAMSAFHNRIKGIKFQVQYTNALTTLGASGSDVNQFDAAVQALLSAYQTVDTTYGPYFQNPQQYLTANNTTDAAVQAAIQTVMQNAFVAFQTGIASSNTDISTMETAVASALGISVTQLPPGFGVAYNPNGQQINWPIPQTVAVNWVANVLKNGGSLVYNRTQVAADMPIPSNMSWMTSRNTYSGIPSTSFQALMQIMEDVQIAEFIQYNYYNTHGQSQTADAAAQENYQKNIQEIMSYVSGTTDGSTAVSSAQKGALLQTMQQPN